MRKVIVTCDRCGKEPPKRIETGKPQTWKVAITCMPDDVHMPLFHHLQRYQEAEWCTECVEEMKVKIPLVRADEQPQKSTLEECIREIVRSETNGG